MVRFLRLRERLSLKFGEGRHLAFYTDRKLRWEFGHDVVFSFFLLDLLSYGYPHLAGVGWHSGVSGGDTYHTYLISFFLHA